MWLNDLPLSPSSPCAVPLFHGPLFLVLHILPPFSSYFRDHTLKQRQQPPPLPPSIAPTPSFSQQQPYLDEIRRNAPSSAAPQKPPPAPDGDFGSRHGGRPFSSTPLARQLAERWGSGSARHGQACRRVVVDGDDVVVRTMEQSGRCYGSKTVAKGHTVLNFVLQFLILL